MDMLNLIRENFRIAGRVNFVHRIVYIGEHMFPDAEQFNIRDFMAANIKAVHEEYCDEMLSGFMLCYPRHFVQLLEGSEDTLLRHLHAVVDGSEPRIGRLKLLVVSHHIKQRMFPMWSAKHCHPPALIDKLAPDSTPEEIAGYITGVVRKLYGLADVIRRQSVNTLRVMMVSLSESVPTFLPETDLVDFLLTTSSPLVLDLKDYVHTYATVPSDTHYEEKVWPAMCDYIPYNPYEVDDEEPVEPAKA